MPSTDITWQRNGITNIMSLSLSFPCAFESSHLSFPLEVSSKYDITNMLI